MKLLGPYFSLLFVFVLLLKPNNAINTWCKQHFEGFEVHNDYNPNLPPTENVNVKDFHVLNQIEEVLNQ